MPKEIPPPTINRRGKLPPHRQVADWLQKRILAGDFDPPGDIPLPSELELVELLGIARDTARRAMALLRDRELIETVATRGSYTTQTGRELRRHLEAARSQRAARQRDDTGPDEIELY